MTQQILCTKQWKLMLAAVVSPCSLETTYCHILEPILNPWILKKIYLVILHSDSHIIAIRILKLLLWQSHYFIAVLNNYSVNYWACIHAGDEWVWCFGIVTPTGNLKDLWGKRNLYQLLHQKFLVDWPAIKTRLHGTTLFLSLGYRHPAFSFCNTHIQKN
jgi:hypothetical protein